MFLMNPKIEIFLKVWDKTQLNSFFSLFPQATKKTTDQNDLDDKCWLREKQIILIQYCQLIDERLAIEKNKICIYII